MTTITLEPRTSIDQSAFMAWLDAAQPGDEIFYHRGMLARDCNADHLRLAGVESKLAHQIAMRASAVRRAAQFAAGLATEAINVALVTRSTYFDARLERRVDLVQRRLGAEDFLYVARRK